MMNHFRKIAGKEAGLWTISSSGAVLLLSMIGTVFSLSSVHVNNSGRPVHATQVHALTASPDGKRKLKRSRFLRRVAGKYAGMVEKAAVRAHVSPVLVASVLHVENRGKINHCADRVSSAGAIGPMQLMPDTAWNSLRVNPWNPRENIAGGAVFLHRLLHQFHGNVRLALVAYNAGPTITAAGHAPARAWDYAQAVLTVASRSGESVLSAG